MIWHKALKVNLNALESDLKEVQLEKEIWDVCPVAMLLRLKKYGKLVHEQ